MNGKLKIAVIGAGRIGSRHIATLQGIESVGEVLVYDEGRQDLSTVSSADAAIASADGVVIATPTLTHADYVRSAIAVGKPTFCEKPLTLNVLQDERLVEEVEDSGVPVQMGFQRRFDPSYIEAKNKLSELDGTVTGFHMRAFDANPPSSEYLKTSGRIFKDMFIHDFDVARWLFGELASVMADGAIVDPQLVAAAEDVDAAVISMRTRNGIVGGLVGGRHNYSTGQDVTVDIYSTAGTIAIRPAERRRYSDFFDRFSGAFEAEMAYFVKVASGAAEPMCVPRDALEALKLAEAAERSWLEKTPVSMDVITV